MAEDNEIYNELSGRVVGNVNQIGVHYGSIGGLPSSSGQRYLDKVQTGLLQNLAQDVRSTSVPELKKWGLADRDPLPVCWRTAADSLVDPPKGIYGGAEPVPLDGYFTEILSVYEAVRSERLVILGNAGAGKSLLARRLILGLIKKWETGQDSRVPVWFSLRCWNPAEIELPRWLTQQLIREFPYLGDRDRTTWARQAELLVESGHILPVLDGFDEIPRPHHREAIGKISKFAKPLIVTSRSDDYAIVARGIKAIRGAAAITLEPLTLREARDYLRHTANKKCRSAWDEVFDHIQTAPDEPVSQRLTAVLTSPLMVEIARTACNNKAFCTPLDLLAPQHFHTTRAVEDRLTDRFITTVYARSNTRLGWITPWRYR